MLEPVDGQPAYVLHRRAYRESSALVELLTRDHGRVGAVVRGVKRSRRTAAEIEPFARIALAWRGRGELVTVLRSETVTRRHLTGDALFAGLYLNELLIKTLGRQEPLVDLFDHYEAALDSLARQSATANRRDVEPTLRTFERRLLDELGYGIAFDRDVASGRPIEGDKRYRMVDGEGFEQYDEAGGANTAMLLEGRHIAAIRDGEFADAAVRVAAKKVLRAAIAQRLNGKALNTRTLFAGTAVSGHQRTIGAH